MSTRLFDHIDLRVKNRGAAQQFYAQILPAIGFGVDRRKQAGSLLPGKCYELGVTTAPDGTIKSADA